MFYTTCWPRQSTSQSFAEVAALTVGHDGSQRLLPFRSSQGGVQLALALPRPSWLQQQLLALFAEGLGL